MTKWNKTAELKSLFTEKEDYESVAESMTKVANKLDTLICFANFDYSEFRNIPIGNERFNHLDYANSMLNDLYDYADSCRIWIK